MKLPYTEVWRTAGRIGLRMSRLSLCCFLSVGMLALRKAIEYPVGDVLSHTQFDLQVWSSEGLELEMEIQYMDGYLNQY